MLITRTHSPSTKCGKTECLTHETVLFYGLYLVVLNYYYNFNESSPIIPYQLVPCLWAIRLEKREQDVLLDSCL